jgi:hypothetical protein
MDKYKSELRKALTASSASGTALIPEDLEDLIRANLLAMSPLTRMVPTVQAVGNVHEVVRRTAHNSSAWFEGEMTPAAYSQSTYARRTVEAKILRTHGQASDFMVSAARSFTDVLADEIESATEGLSDLFEFSTLYGCADDLTNFAGDAYQYSGVYPWLLEDAAATNVIDPDGTVTLTQLDNAIDLVMKYRNLGDMQWLFLMSMGMQSKVTGLQTLIRRQSQPIEFEGGFRMETYRDIPILPTTFTEPTDTALALTSATETGSGGGIGLGDGTYRYKIAAVTLYGEQESGAMQSAAVTQATHDTVELAWTADANAKLYTIYRTGAGDADSDANYDLIDIVAAKTYDGAGTVSGNVASYSDDGSFAGLDQVHPLGSGEEVIFLLGLGRRQGVARPVLTPSLGEPMDNLVSFVPLVETTDSVQFRLKAYHTLQVPWGQLQVAIRRVTPT